MNGTVTATGGNWRTRAACRTADPELFVGPLDEPLDDRHVRVNQAIAVCAPCPVRQQCLDFALAADERDGIYGGFTEWQRRRIHEGGTVPRPLYCRRDRHPRTAENTGQDGRCTDCGRGRERAKPRHALRDGTGQSAAA
jgi:WhiB family transcriptional regulator, redox-sensing transcriptional regulator